ncbi:MAG: histidine ammonia-lyase [Gammaproteobacteria bacterium]|nr:histidine ammonia-lyase [Gammaproteobacteria bacterium]NNC97087.1 histidine ammonia-lyase [Gammaproteobacteria bacterium]NNM14074.1 histidine ammonia-lyase [Gammaproteobacteria bacterium]
MSNIITLTGNDLKLEHIHACFAGPVKAQLCDSAKTRMQQSVDTVVRVVTDNKTCYGINTGFGAFAKQSISSKQVQQLQLNLVRSHACGVGNELEPGLVRAIMLLKANSLAQGVSGIRPQVLETLLALLNKDVIPRIPAQGSVGASGDLAPLAHLALCLIGEGKAQHAGQTLQAEKVLHAVGCKPEVLQAKEGLALLNGTQVSAALAMQAARQTRVLLKTSILAGALSVEALCGSYAPFDARIHQVRNLDTQARIAAAFRSLLSGSSVNQSHTACDRVQDPYALRCMPQVYGAVLATLEHAEEILQKECNSVSDNPLIFDDEVLSGGNFHAAPLGFVSDFLAIALTELGNMSERRTDCLLRQVNPALNMFLTSSPGLESGLMMAHVTAAALASENKTLAHPASVDTIPTSAGQEDHVSMAPWAGRKCLNICENVVNILAIELLCASRGLHALLPLETTVELKPLLATIQLLSEDSLQDQPFATCIQALSNAIMSQALITNIIIQGRKA